MLACTRLSRGCSDIQYRVKRNSSLYPLAESTKFKPNINIRNLRSVQQNLRGGLPPTLDAWHLSYPCLFLLFFLGLSNIPDFKKKCSHSSGSRANSNHPACPTESTSADLEYKMIQDKHLPFRHCDKAQEAFLEETHCVAPFLSGNQINSSSHAHLLMKKY